MTMINTMIDNADCPSYLEKIGAIDAWRWAQGEPPIISILDTCIDEKHQVFEGRVYKKDSVCKPKEPKLSDTNYRKAFSNYLHGTAVSGTIAAKITQLPLHNNNGNLKICGIAPAAHIHGFEFDFSIAGPDELSAKFSDLLQFKYINITKKHNKHLFKKHHRLTTLGSLSMGEEDVIGLNRDDWNQFMLDACKHDAFLGVVAVGNDSVDLETHQDKYMPANIKKPDKCTYDPLLRVGSLRDTRDIQKADHSNYGRNVDILAPGENIPVPIPFGKSYIVSGTSFAAPIVSGTIALLLQCNPFAKASELRQAIIDNADQDSSLSSYVQGGRVLNVLKTVRAFCLKPKIMPPVSKKDLHDEL